MTVSLGPMPPRLRCIVAGWIEAGRRKTPQETDDEINAIAISGGPAYLTYLDADGEVWILELGEQAFKQLGDGPMKVASIAAAADKKPELSEWLPRRPFGAIDCTQCAGRGWWLPPLPRVICNECHGLGWLVPN
jgi:hypothetical protein